MRDPDVTRISGSEGREMLQTTKRSGTSVFGSSYDGPTEVNGDNASISVSNLFQPQAQGECGGEQGLPRLRRDPTVT
jgi:hypothetical protein